ncbi:acyl-CoA N-acyltransferase [Coniella lustricola]|uniref:Acyl-CoA N-acyltransferase n=1 Tax=Coniella lustricola TaxID=2025994 RepID=A0A2T3A715_9PEZI|nr:acyl-CoA N-acyltransferase [Coniella lustricola]
MIASAYQDRGYGTEAVNWALDWAFRVAGMHAVRLSCFSFNERAAKLYTSLGFVREGVKREAYYFDCRWYNRIMFSILDREWAARRGVVGGSERGRENGLGIGAGEKHG